MEIGYHASHEQYAPGHLLSLVQRAQEAGFGVAMCSDHFAPFSLRQGSGGFAWSWLGAALASTTLSFGTVSAPGQRYHPAIIAQAVATLAEMYPGRFWVALGSGQAVNEHITGDAWPAKDVRNQRLLECAEMIRRLLSGETASHDGLVRARDARLFVEPRILPRIYAAAITKETARWAAGWSDGLITVYQPEGRLGEVLGAYREGGGEGRPVLLQAQHQYDVSREAGLAAAHDQWRQCVLVAGELEEMPSPEAIDEATASATLEDVAKAVRISPDPEEHIEWLREYERLGVAAVYVHNVGKNQEYFIDEFGKRVLPAFVQGAGARRWP